MIQNLITNPFAEIFDQLAEIKSLVERINTPTVTSVTLPENLTSDQAIEHFKSQGIPIKKSNFYQLTSKGELPSQRIGKRLILSRTELNEYIESRKYRRTTHKERAAKALADSATIRLKS